MSRHQHTHWEHGQECAATYLYTEKEFASHNWEFYEENRECTVEEEPTEQEAPGGVENVFIVNCIIPDFVN